MKVEGVYRLLFMTIIARKKSSFLVVEFPKSGGSWLTKMLSELLDIDFPQNRFPSKRASAFQGHYLKGYGQKKIVVLWRDPKDIMVSWYFHSVVGNTHSNERFVESVRKNCGISRPEDVSVNLIDFIKYSFSGEMSPGFTWNDFYDRWRMDDSVIHVSYEELRRNAFSALKRISIDLGYNVEDEKIKDVVASNSFERMTGRKEGDVDVKSFARKGIVGDWKNYFSQSALEEFYALTAGRSHGVGDVHD